MNPTPPVAIPDEIRAHGIVDDRREGTVVWYTLLTPCVMSFFSCTRAVLEERA